MQKYGCKVDVYSLGLTFLSLTVRTFNPVRFFSLRDFFSWPSDFAQGDVEAAIIRVAEHYSDELTSVLRICVERDPADRPSIQTLLSWPYVAQQVRLLILIFLTLC